MFFENIKARIIMFKNIWISKSFSFIKTVFSLSLTLSVVSNCVFAILNSQHNFRKLLVENE